MKDLSNCKFGRLTAIRPTNKRKNGCVVWECHCDCGNDIEVCSAYLNSGQKKSCGCLEKENQKSIGNRIDNKKDVTGQRFGRLIALYPTDKRLGSSVVWHCKCDCGNEKDISLGNLGKTIFSCGCLSREVHSNIMKELFPKANLINKRYGKLIVLESYEDKKSKYDTYWKCLCDCGNECIVSTRSLTGGHTFSCGCLKQSHGEFIILNILKENNIPFQSEYRFDDCIFPNSKKQAVFDFFITLGNSQYIIEYDGEQHFRYTNNGWNNKKNFEKTIERDKFKNQWCKDNNIPLIRIPYTHLNNICLEDLLLETSKFIL